MFCQFVPTVCFLLVKYLQVSRRCQIIVLCFQRREYLTPLMSDFYSFVMEVMEPAVFRQKKRKIAYNIDNIPSDVLSIVLSFIPFQKDNWLSVLLVSKRFCA